MYVNNIDAPDANFFSDAQFGKSWKSEGKTYLFITYHAYL
jgi:hypothetical protein